MTIDDSRPQRRVEATSFEPIYCIYMSVRNATGSRRTFGWQGIALLLLVALNGASVGAVICPTSCAMRSGVSHSSAMPDGTGCPHCNSRGSKNRQNPPCSHSSSACQSHIPHAAVFIPSLCFQLSTTHTLPAVADVFLSLLMPSFSRTSPSPPGPLTGRSICQRQALLRI